MANSARKRKKMDRKRNLESRARGLTSMDVRQDISGAEDDQLGDDFAQARIITDCIGRPGICGMEAACQAGENSTSRCVCPHDKSLPTADLKCPVRVTVPFPNAKPIHDIIPPGVNLTKNATLRRGDSEQVERLEAKIPVTSIVGAFVFFSIFAFGLIFYCKRRSYYAKAKRRDLEASPMNLKNSLLLANKYTPNPQYFNCTSPEVQVLSRASVVFLQDIGEGCFGKVYKGEWMNSESTEVVAIKVLKDSASREAEEDFMREVEIMSTFRHENILALIGVVLRDPLNGPWMVFEYMPFGDLAEVLRKNSPTLRSPTPGLPPLTKESLHLIVKQIAEGMSYLAAQRFVHRDLACRNCLVGSDLVVKIADFGMSRDVYTCDYYKIGGSRLLPVRWMSPESVMYGRFTLESDVWSFGVVLWEVFSYGKQPYFGHNNEEVVKLILHGIMLIPPEDCPTNVCQLMKDCWRTEPRDRLSFCDILDRLNEFPAESKACSQIGTLPRPPQGPVTIRTPDAVDSEGYLLPSPVTLREYLQPLPMAEISV